MSNVIAIAGPAASGKSTVARLLAERLNIPYVNTGSLYRAVALAARLADQEMSAISSDFLSSLKLEYVQDPSGSFILKLNGVGLDDELRNAEIAFGASLVAKQPIVRDYLLHVQRSFAKDQLIVMEGRDIGTVVFPDARYKFFITATPYERARRRLAQANEVPDGATLAEVAKAIEERDKQDSERAIAPLKPAIDAELIDTTGVAVEEVVDLIEKKIKAGRETK